MMQFTPGWYIVDSEGVQIPGTNRYDSTGEAIEKARELIEANSFDDLYLLRVRFKYSIKIQATTSPVSADGGPGNGYLAGQASHPPSHALMEDDLG